MPDMDDVEPDESDISPTAFEVREWHNSRQRAIADMNRLNSELVGNLTRNQMPTPIKAKVLHCYGESHDKVYVVWVENRGTEVTPFFVCGGYGKRTISGMLKVDPKGSFATYSSACNKMDDVVDTKIKKGYLDVESNAYHVSNTTGAVVRFSNFVNPQKIDVSRIIGYSTTTEVVAAPTPVLSKPKQHQVQVGTARVRRAVDL